MTQVNKPVDLTHILQSLPWFLELKSNQCDQLARISSFLFVDNNTILFSEGDQEDLLYILLEGRVSIEIDIPTIGTKQICIAEPLDIIGWSSMTPVVRQRTARARAIEACQLVTFRAKSLQRICEEDPQIGYTVMKRLSNVIASRLLTTRIQLIDLIMKS
jgi:CRP-like cAMP-binding protein